MWKEPDSSSPVRKPIPTEALCTDASCKEHGLHADYFQQYEGRRLADTIAHRCDCQFRVGRYGNVATTPEKLFRALDRRSRSCPRLETISSALAGRMAIASGSTDNLIVEDWRVHHPASIETKKMHLEQGHAYAVKIEYFQDVRSAEARFIWSPPDQAGREAVEAARNADLVVVAMGLSARIEGEEMKVDADGFAGGDRTKIDLPAPQEELLEKIHAAGKPVVLVLMNGSALSINWADANLPAILEAWYPGEEGGTAVAGAMAGDFSPGGTFAGHILQIRRSASAVRGLLDGEAHLSVFRRRAAVSVRLRPQLHFVHLQECARRSRENLGERRL